MDLKFDSQFSTFLKKKKRRKGGTRPIKKEECAWCSCLGILFLTNKTGSNLAQIQSGGHCEKPFSSARHIGIGSKIGIFGFVNLMVWIFHYRCVFCKPNMHSESTWLKCVARLIYLMNSDKERCEREQQTETFNFSSMCTVVRRFVRST